MQPFACGVLWLCGFCVATIWFLVADVLGKEMCPGFVNRDCVSLVIAVQPVV
jgi:hypothetical protein